MSGPEDKENVISIFSRGSDGAELRPVPFITDEQADAHTEYLLTEMGLPSPETGEIAVPLTDEQRNIWEEIDPDMPEAWVAQSVAKFRESRKTTIAAARKPSRRYRRLGFLFGRLGVQE